MNTKEIEIANSIIESILSTEEIAQLKQSLQTEDNFQHFLSKYIEIAIGMDQSISLMAFLEFNNIASKFASFKHKATDLIEELADLNFNGHNSNSTNFLQSGENAIFLNQLEFLKNTNKAIKINQRSELKKKFQQLEKLDAFDLTENEIKSAINILERQKIKSRLNEIASSEKKEAKIISINFKTVLKYAAIIILILSPAIFFINRLNHIESNNGQELADNKKPNKVDTAANKKKQQLDTFKLPAAELYSIDNEVLKSKNFGFKPSLITKVKISVINISNQIDALEHQCKIASIGNSNAGFGTVAKQYCASYDSLISITETYTFDKKVNTLSIYTKKWKANKKLISQMIIISFDKKNENIIYLKTDINYYLIKDKGINNLLSQETDEELIDQLKLIENQNE